MQNYRVGKGKLLWIVFLIISIGMLSFTGTAKSDSTAKLNNDKKWRIGYYEGGPYPIYHKTLRATVEGLMELGWIKKTTFPVFSEADDAQSFWNWLSTEIDSEYLQFVPDACWSAKWEKELRQENKMNCLSRLQNQYVDLVIAMGTWAGKDLSNNDHSVPVLVGASADPVKAKIVKSIEDPGLDHVTAHCDPTRFIRQLRLFHSLFKFKKLGVVFEDTEAGRIYANLEDIRKVSLEENFEVIECNAAGTDVAKEDARDQVQKCHEEIAETIDALWIHAHLGYSPEFFPDLLKSMYKQKVFTWSRQGQEWVRRGVLMSIAKGDYKARGLWYAKKISQIFNGIKPRQLEQFFRDPQRIAINAETANVIGYHIPPNLLRVAEKVYKQIEAGEPHR